MRNAAFLIALWLFTGAAHAQDISVTRVHFPAGQTGTTIKGVLKGNKIADYLLGASAGQRITISLKTNNTSSYFNLMPAGSETAIHNGSTNDNDYRGTLPSNGDYRIRVYLMRNAARRNESASYTLSVSIGGAAAANPSSTAPDYADGLMGGPDYWQVRGVPSGDKLNVRSDAGSSHDITGTLTNGEHIRNLGCKTIETTKWCHIRRETERPLNGWVAGRYLVEAAAMPGEAARSQTTGEIPCAARAGQPTMHCPFRSTRGRNGHASVWVQLPSGDERYIEFIGGIPLNTDPGLKIAYEKVSDLYLIRVGGEERYEIPEAVVYGG
ncbi:MAG: SH3 domain-containing protein [Xanthobacteraceae bacterium]